MENLMEREEEPAEDIMDASLVHTSKEYNELLQLIQTTLQKTKTHLSIHTCQSISISYPCLQYTVVVMFVGG